MTQKPLWLWPLHFVLECQVAALACLKAWLQLASHKLAEQQQQNPRR